MLFSFIYIYIKVLKVFIISFIYLFFSFSLYNIIFYHVYRYLLVTYGKLKLIVYIQFKYGNFFFYYWNFMRYMVFGQKLNYTMNSHLLSYQLNFSFLLSFSIHKLLLFYNKTTITNTIFFISRLYIFIFYKLFSRRLYLYFSLYYNFALVDRLLLFIVQLSSLIVPNNLVLYFSLYSRAIRQRDISLISSLTVYLLFFYKRRINFGLLLLSKFLALSCYYSFITGGLSSYFFLVRGRLGYRSSGRSQIFKFGQSCSLSPYSQYNELIYRRVSLALGELGIIICFTYRLIVYFISIYYYKFNYNFFCTISFIFYYYISFNFIIYNILKIYLYLLIIYNWLINYYSFLVFRSFNNLIFLTINYNIFSSRSGHTFSYIDTRSLLIYYNKTNIDFGIYKSYNFFRINIISRVLTYIFSLRRRLLLFCSSSMRSNILYKKIIYLLAYSNKISNIFFLVFTNTYTLNSIYKIFTSNSYMFYSNYIVTTGLSNSLVYYYFPVSLYCYLFLINNWVRLYSFYFFSISNYPNKWKILYFYIDIFKFFELDYYSLFLSTIYSSRSYLDWSLLLFLYLGCYFCSIYNWKYYY